jgi:uncharacterized protein (UPF0276 family)
LDERRDDGFRRFLPSVIGQGMNSANPIFGLGLRPQHFQEILEGAAGADWFEVVSENYMIGGGRPLANLMAIRKRYPMALHGVSLSIGSADPLDGDYLNRLRDLAERVEPVFISDHFCWTGVAGMNTHDLLPLAMNEATISHLCSRIDQVQERLGQPIALENTSTYVGFADSTIPEWEFIVAVARRTGCKLLLDVNNVYVNAFNHGFDSERFIDHIPGDLIAYVHLAGHENNQTHIIDTHDHPIADPVWDLYGHLMARCPGLPTIIERDDRIPPYAELVGELDRARAVAAYAKPGGRARSA